MISVIIPTLNAESYIEKLIEVLKSQKLEGICNNGNADDGDELEIIVIDSESDDKSVEIAKAGGARVLNVKRTDFDHGGTRNIAWHEAKGEIICFLTQDALPKDEYYIANLIKGFEDSKVMMISGRQIPKSDANPVERLTRQFNYPDKSFVRTKDDVERLGIKAYFFSDACAAYRRSILEEMGGFESPILTNEDMLMAARVINKGYAIGYAADAMVYHSHNFTLSYQYSRNFDVSVFLKMYESEIKSSGTTGEGIRMVLYTEKELLKQFKIFSMIRCVFESAAKYLGNSAGRDYDKMSQKEILVKTTNPAFWTKRFNEEK